MRETNGATEASGEKKKVERKNIEDSAIYKAVSEKIDSTRVQVAKKSMNISGTETDVEMTVSMDGTYRIISTTTIPSADGSDPEQKSTIEYEGKSRKSACAKFQKI